MNKYSILTILVLTIVTSCSKVSESDITRACIKIGNTPKYLAPSVHADEYYKLVDKSGKKSSASALSLEYSLKNMELSVMSGSAYSFQDACEKDLRDDFLN